MELLQNAVPIDVLLLGAVFLMVILLVAGCFLVIGGRREAVVPIGSPSLRFEAPEGPIARWLSQVGSRAAETYEVDQRHRIRLKLIQAGYRNPAAIYIYYAARLVLAIALPFLMVAFSYLLVGNMPTRTLMFTGFASGGLGLYLPTFWLSRRVASRQKAIRHSFPDALDMMLVCVEAGAGLAAALDRVAMEVSRAHPILGEELRLVSAGLSAGQSRTEALRQFAQRAGVDDISSFATIMIQSEAFGTSIGDTLRVQATEMRQKRLLRAEEMANKLPVKITMPMALMIFPVIILVIMTPIIIRILEAVTATS